MRWPFSDVRTSAPSHPHGAVRLRSALGASLLRVERTIGGGQLQHGRALAFTQIGHQQDLAAGQLERVVMHARLGFVDAPEARDFGTELARRENAEAGFALDLAIEREFGSRLQANGYVGLAVAQKPPVSECVNWL